MKRADLVEEDETAHVARGGGREAMMLRDWCIYVHWRVLLLLLLLNMSILYKWRWPCSFH